MTTQSGRVALVTGASRGIGRAAAVALAREGWRVVCVARSQKALEKLDDEIRESGGEATLVPLDLRDLNAIDGLAAPLLERFGKLDSLVACAGARLISVDTLTDATATVAAWAQAQGIDFARVAGSPLLR